MEQRENGDPSVADLEKTHAEMLEAALARPGVREMMEVYGNSQEMDRGLDSYRAAAKNPVLITNSDSSSTS